eukprot:scaffold31809_cov38-Attheya_sp.AAC.1
MAKSEDSSSSSQRSATDNKRRDEVPTKWPPFNPFVRHPTSRLGLLKMMLFGPILVPIRLTGAILTLLLALAWVNVASLGCDTKAPYSPLRRTILLGGCRVLARILLFFYGYIWIHETRETPPENNSNQQQQTPAPKKASLIVVNHVGFAELLYLASRDGCCFVSKAENRSLPVIGRVAEVMQCIFVDRGDTTAQHGGGAGAATSSKSTTTMEEILERAQAEPGTWPPLALCPEGTTTTGHCLIQMRTGAFTPGLPVQPVMARAPFSPIHGYDPSFSAVPMVQHILCLMSQPMNHLHMIHLNVYTPNDDEQKDAKLFANNVRQRMADVVGCNFPTYNLTFFDKLPYELSEKQREMGRNRWMEKNGGVLPTPPVFSQDAFGNPLESAKAK